MDFYFKLAPGDLQLTTPPSVAQEEELTDVTDVTDVIDGS